jgi:hypothetical protein
VGFPKSQLCATLLTTCKQAAPPLLVKPSTLYTKHIIMATFAPPTRRGDFLYSSVLYADAGNSNHHPRASVADLAALLRPEAPNLYNKGRKPETSSPAKDPPWHFYSAQLIHYGLPVTKDKNGAKVRLLTAMNQFKLEVPAWVLKVEGELKKEWEAENRKMKKSARAVVGPINKVSSKGKANTTPSMSSGVNVTRESYRMEVLEDMCSQVSEIDGILAPRTIPFMPQSRTNTTEVTASKAKASC